MEHDIRLVIATSALGLQATGAGYTTRLRIGALFGVTYAAEGWTQAMSILTCTANILPLLAEEDRPRALYQGLSNVADECAGKRLCFVVEPLPLAPRPGGVEAVAAQLHQGAGRGRGRADVAHGHRARAAVVNRGGHGLRRRHRSYLSEYGPYSGFR